MSKYNQIKGRKIRLAKNTISSFIFQIMTIVCGLILPRLFISHFGSKVNGLVNSISQFLSIISLLEMGVGAVIQSALYKPLAEKDNKKISEIYVSASKFFRIIGKILFVYVLILIIFYPRLVNKNFGYLYTAALIIAMSISYFAQYYFGLVNQLLVTADQHGYIQYNVQTLTLVANTIACVILIYFGASVQIVKLTTSLIYLIRPIYLNYYVDKHYSINKKIKYTNEPIPQKWNGIAQHVASFVLSGTDVLVLTVFSSLDNVSIYNVYFLVINGITLLVESLTAGFGSLLGELYARNEKKELDNTFSWTEWSIHTLGIFLFGCTLVLIIPFVRVYTLGVNDANYVVPAFAYLITIAYLFHCLRIPYSNMILAAGHYKQTQSNYVMAAVINIIVSILMVKRYGLVGVAIGTLVSMAYQTIWMAYYIYKNILQKSIKYFWKNISIDAFIIVIGFFVTFNIPLVKVNAFYWIILALIDVALWLLIILVIEMFFCKDKTLRVLRKVLKK